MDKKDLLNQAKHDSTYLSAKVKCLGDRWNEDRLVLVTGWFTATTGNLICLSIYNIHTIQHNRHLFASVGGQVNSP